jgi:hypothetical protein
MMERELGVLRDFETHIVLFQLKRASRNSKAGFRVKPGMTTKKINLS